MSNVSKVKEVILSGGKYSKQEIADLVGLPTETVRGVLRDLRKPRFGGYAIHSARNSRGVCMYWFDPSAPVSVASGSHGNETKIKVYDDTVDRIVNEVMVELFTRMSR